MDDLERRTALVAHRLVELSRDCASTLSTAAEVAESVAAGQQYRRRAATWRDFGQALVQAAGAGEEAAPPFTAGAAGALQRAWIKIKSAVGDSDAIEEECTKRETQALRRCAQTLEAGLPSRLRDIVMRYSQQIEQLQRKSAERT
jgi:uncharacterized protein (TIGR02284 family)